MQVSESGIGEKESLVKTANMRILILLGRPRGRSELKNLLADKEFQKANLESIPTLIILQNGGKQALGIDHDNDLSRVIYSLDGLSLYPSPGTPAVQLRTMVWDSANLGDNPHYDLQYSEVIIDELLDFAASGDADSLQFLYGQFGTNTPKFWPQWEKFIAERTLLKLATLEVHLLKVVTPEGKDPTSGMPLTEHLSGMQQWGYLRGVLKANLPPGNYRRYEGASEIQYLLSASNAIEENIKNADQIKRDAEARAKAEKELKAKQLADKEAGDFQDIQKEKVSWLKGISTLGLIAGIGAMLAGFIGFIRNVRTANKRTKWTAKVAEHEVFDPLASWPRWTLALGTILAAGAGYLIFGKDILFLAALFGGAGQLGYYFWAKSRRRDGILISFLAVASFLGFNSAPQMNAQTPQPKVAAAQTGKSVPITMLVDTDFDFKPEIQQLTKHLSSKTLAASVMQLNQYNLAEAEEPARKVATRIRILVLRPGGPAKLKKVINDKTFMTAHGPSLPVLESILRGEDPLGQPKDNIGYIVNNMVEQPSYYADVESLTPQRARTIIWDAANLVLDNLPYEITTMDYLIKSAASDPETAQFLRGDFNGTPAPKSWDDWKESLTQRVLLRLITLQSEFLDAVRMDGTNSATGEPLTEFPMKLQEINVLQGIVHANLPADGYQRYATAPETVRLNATQRAIEKNIHAEEARKKAEAEQKALAEQRAKEEANKPQVEQIQGQIVEKINPSHTGRNVGLGALGGLAALGIGLSMRNRRRQKGFAEFAAMGLLSLVSAGVGAVYEFWLKAFQEGVPFTLQFARDTATTYLSAHAVDLSSLFSVPSFTALALVTLGITYLMIRRQQNAEAKALAKSLLPEMSNSGIFSRMFHKIPDMWTTSLNLITDRIVGKRTAEEGGRLMEAISA